MKYIIPAVLVLCLLSLAGCKKGADRSSSVTATSYYHYASSSDTYEISSDPLISQDPETSIFQIPEDTMLMLSNQTGKTFVKIAIQADGRTNWKELKNIWETPDEFLLSIPAAEMSIKYWNVKMRDSEGNDYIWSRIDVTKSSYVRLYIQDNVTKFEYGRIADE